MLMVMDNHQLSRRRSNSPSLIKRKLQSSICCLGKSQPVISHPSSSSSSSSSSLSSSSSVDVVVAEPRLFTRSSSVRTKPRSHHHNLPELKDKCRNFISRMGRHSRRHSTDFVYDPLSYSLNFDRGDENYLDESPLRSFSARLPHSPPAVSTPPESPATAKSKEISACRWSCLDGLIFFG